MGRIPQKTMRTRLTRRKICLNSKKQTAHVEFHNLMPNPPMGGQRNFIEMPSPPMGGQYSVVWRHLGEVGSFTRGNEWVNIL